MKILVLYMELAGYFVSCLEKYLETYGGEIHVVRYPVAKIAPFRFSSVEGLIYYERKEYEDAALIKLARDLKPDLVYINGWIDKTYKKLGRIFKQEGLPVINAMDNQWKGTLRQKVAALAAPVLIRPYYTHFWVSGVYQYEFARRMGYPRERIHLGMYSADTDLFGAVYEEAMAAKAVQYPHRMLYVGRVMEHKGIPELLESFLELLDEEGHDWELWLAGSGPLKETAPKHERIRFLPFIQPDELPRIALETGALVMPSREEPWGVVLHEFAAAGLPAIASTEVGAMTAFLRDGYNGYVHEAGQKSSLKAALKTLMARPDGELLEMGRRSRELSLQISPAIWASTLHQIKQRFS